MWDRGSGSSPESSIVPSGGGSAEVGGDPHPGSSGHAELPEVDSRTKNYWLYRLKDSSGISGRGWIANVAVFPNGKVVSAWCVPGKPQSVVVFDSVADLLAIHGHGGSTILIPEE